MMQGVTGYKHSFRGAASVLFLVMMLSASPARAQEIQNPTYRQRGKTIVVTYDLMAEEKEEYEVNLLLSADGGQNFDYEPQTVSGDIGEGIALGPGKRIVWTVLEDKPGGLQGTNYQFKITVDGGGNGWLWALGSAVLAGGGGTAALVLSGIIGGSGSGDRGSDESSGPSGNIPSAPGPPN